MVAAADFLGSNAGVVAPGRRVDLLLLDHNPRESIEHSQTIRAVILRGEVPDR
jgi:imidazolonepropionase-like amidohydrolase